MDVMEVVNLCSDDEGEDGIVTVSSVNPHQTNKELSTKNQKYQSHSTNQVSEETILSSGESLCRSYTGTSGLSSPQPLSATPDCRKFWKAGNYDNGLGSKVGSQHAKNYLHVHPLFLHSNATSHKWVFGAIAELLDNAFDEIQNGATSVMVDKILNPKDGSPALLIQDNGNGMDPEAMRRCMSFGFSDKMSNFAIGQYGNGFKTGSMRLGADAIVFSCHMNDMACTKSIGLLSYTFLTRAQLDRIVVPMVSYKCNTSTGYLEKLNHQEHFTSNMSLLLDWSPFLSEAEIVKQFDDIENHHGTKIIVFNLWFNDDGNLELDFDTDPEDILISGDRKKISTLPAWKRVNEQHIANRLQYSLRDYLSILYLPVPKSFRIILRGKAVKLRNLADDLKDTEFIVYRPQNGGSEEGLFVTTIGFVKEAPEVSIHGFNVYNKNRLILPFWPVVKDLINRGRGVVGILQADDVQPTHNKQDFEKTSLFQKLEMRLKDMTWEYWDLHCHKIGYQQKKRRNLAGPLNSSMKKSLVKENPVALDNCSSPVPVSNTQGGSEQTCLTKRKTRGFIDHREMKRQAAETNVTGLCCNQKVQTTASPADQTVDQQTVNLLEQKKKLIAKCSAFEKAEKELNLKVTELRNKLEEANLKYNRLLAEAEELDCLAEL
ncbi:protein MICRORCHIDIA 6-like [Trifolium pratense]|uniref:protein MICRORCHIDIA 6-like n=1 Tax=Trifolium pratense TaxID=57577 RepID=UPI001E6916AE|nr:protein MICRORCHIDIA 6-like [Trifolium pratense]XP_045789511.1 protein MICRORCHIDIA 6-like [Trifolium pratense]